MPKRKAEFAEDSVVTSLIREVQKRPCLWNNEDGEYNDRPQMSAAWEEISNILDIRVDTLRMKWKSLRDFFKKIVRKRDVRDVDGYLGGWRYFRMMWFINKPGLARSDAGSGDETNGSDAVKCEPLVFGGREPLAGQRGPTPGKRRRKSSEEEYEQMFLESLTPYLKQLEPIRKLVVRNKIQEVLLNELAAQETSGSKYY